MTSTGQLTLRDFILARVADDETALQAWADHQGVDLPLAVIATDGIGPATRRWTAEIEARRDIARRHGNCGTGIGYCDDGGHGWESPGCADLASAALPYADHPDYREEWRP